MTVYWISILELATTHVIVSTLNLYVASASLLLYDFQMDRRGLDI